MRNLSIQMILLVIFTHTATSQIITNSDINNLLKNQEIQLENPIINDFLKMTQIQNNSDNLIPAEGTNTAVISQKGDLNIGLVEQSGSGQSLYLVQNGIKNTAYIGSLGNNVVVEAVQIGDDNFINSYIENNFLESRTAKLRQQGSGNRIILDLQEAGVPLSTDGQLFSISQNGNGHAATVTGENFDSPIIIDQTPGAGGTGMQIEINTSYFSFPNP